MCQMGTICCFFVGFYCKKDKGYLCHNKHSLGYLMSVKGTHGDHSFSGQIYFFVPENKFGT